jgi:hypothetical protein
MEHSFDIFYLNSEEGAIGEAIHEMIHFVWFYVWNKTFGDSYAYCLQHEAEIRSHIKKSENVC